VTTAAARTTAISNNNNSNNSIVVNSVSPLVVSNSSQIPVDQVTNGVFTQSNISARYRTSRHSKIGSNLGM
jgi:hypothetical protein